MRPGLMLALAATLLASTGLALWADPPEADAAVAAVAPSRRPAAITAVPASVPAPAPRIDAGTPGRPPETQLPTRAADWPPPTAAGLAAWQGKVTAVVARAPVPALPASAVARPAAVFPYRWIGQLDDGGGPAQQLLASDQRSVGVRLGATLDGRWRLQRDPAGRLLAQVLPDGVTVPVPGAPVAPAALP